MSAATDRGHESPYPDGMDRRLADLEGWRGTVDEWRRGMDTWRSMIDREGLVTAVAVVGTKMDRVETKLDRVESKVEKLEDDLTGDRGVRRGVAMTGRTIALFVAGGAGIATIIGLLIALLAGGNP